MKTVLLVTGDRPVPSNLLSYIQSADWQYKTYEAENNSLQSLNNVDAVLLLSPCTINDKGYEYSEQLWYSFMRQQYAHLPLLIAGYSKTLHTNYLDLLKLDYQSKDWWDNLLPVLDTDQNDYQDSLSPKLFRFFAGHGTDSIIAVLTRIRMVVQMAQRELIIMQTPYTEIYQDLIAPAQLATKWNEWRNRWINYYPLFKHTPLGNHLKEVAKCAQSLDDWMLNGGLDEGPLADGKILTILNAVRDILQEIENKYVLQKLPYSHR